MSAHVIGSGRRRTARRHRARRGSVYVLVLGTALVVTILGLTAVAVTRVSLRAEAQDADARQAALLAQSAAEHAVAAVASDVTWRDKHVDGDETAPVAC